MVPNTTAKGYDFQETSSGRHALVGKQVKKADFGADHDYEGGCPWAGMGGWARGRGV